MDKYKVIYFSTHDGDITTVWLYADDEVDAENQFRQEYHDIERISQIYKMD